MKTQIIGRKAVIEAINNNVKISHIYLLKYQSNIVDLANAKKIPISYQNNEEVFKQLDRNVNHQGCVATRLTSEINYMNFEWLIKRVSQKSKAIIVVLDEIADVHNFGAILRTCEAMQVDAVIFKKNNQAPINDVVEKVSMGAINYLNLIQVANLNSAISKLKDHNFWVYGSALEGSNSLYESKFDDKSIIVVGNEQKGISQLLLKNCDFKIRIPMHGNVQSLNASVATGIILSYVKNQIINSNKN